MGWQMASPLTAAAQNCLQTHIQLMTKWQLSIKINNNLTTKIHNNHLVNQQASYCIVNSTYINWFYSGFSFLTFKTEWRLIPATLCGWRRCFAADQLWLMKRIREEDFLLTALQLSDLEKSKINRHSTDTLCLYRHTAHCPVHCKVSK